MAETMISPQKLYENPEKFGGIMALGAISGHNDYPVNVFNLVKRMHPDFSERLASSMKEYIVMTKDNKPAIFFGKDTVNLIEIPDEIYEEIKKFL